MTNGKAFLQELRDFLAFLASLWGVLAAVSVFFPLSNLLVEAVPLGQGGEPFHAASPGLVALLSSLSCTFLTFATFGRRSELGDEARRRRFARSARWSFVGALVLLAFYVLGYRSLYEVMIVDTQGSIQGAGLYDAVIAALYILSFALITRAFLLLAMLEYFPAAAPPVGSRSDS